MTQKLNRNYVSDIDLFLAKFDATHPPVGAHQEYIAKHARIAALRDTKTCPPSEPSTPDEAPEST